MDLLEKYRIAHETRNFEIEMFWKRCNYFLVLNTAVATGFFALSNAQDSWYKIALVVLGIIVSLIWFFVGLGGKFWQCRWEQRLLTIEKEIGGGCGLFSATWEEIKLDVEESLSNDGECKKKLDWIDRQIMKKPSVSKQMIYLSLIFLLFWCFLFVAFIIKSCHFSCFCVSCVF
ncbi:MAG: hypothetical protein FWC38_04515 [Proteobacteria bacterium]|nr:hypothetical protein [Pseudomonadota bacterium]MCL2307486.1 hypothetical protein [Pseudomonadota bacterium]